MLKTDTRAGFLICVQTQSHARRHTHMHTDKHAETHERTPIARVNIQYINEINPKIMQQLVIIQGFMTLFFRFCVINQIKAL